MRLPALILTAAALSACSSLYRDTRQPISLDEIARLSAQKRPKARAYEMTFRIEEGKDTLAAPKVTSKPGQAATIEVVREFRYPTDFEVARISTGGDVVRPLTPTAFGTRLTGISIEATAKPDGAFIMLTGEVLATEFEGFRPNVGDGFRPIHRADGQVITPNVAKSPVFTTRHTPFAVAALPGRTYRFPIHAKTRTTIEVTCVELR
ncbi:MAG: hypothetical protein ABI680_01860 [Chthoniobacteraceae bacterium]